MSGSKVLWDHGDGDDGGGGGGGGDDGDGDDNGDGEGDGGSVSVWSAFAGATVSQSDAFALYPLWPSEMVSAAGTGCQSQLST